LKSFFRSKIAGVPALRYYKGFPFADAFLKVIEKANGGPRHDSNAPNKDIAYENRAIGAPPMHYPWVNYLEACAVPAELQNVVSNPVVGETHLRTLVDIGIQLLDTPYMSLCTVRLRQQKLAEDLIG